MESLEFRLFDFQTKDENGIFMIEMFGINEKGETVYIKVDDFQPFFYILVDQYWTDKTVVRFIQMEIEQKVKNAITTVKGELCEYNKLYWFSGDKKSKFLRLSFNNMSSYYKARTIFYDKNGKKIPKYYKTTLLQIYETKIPPLLRYFHINQISPSGWVKLYKTRCQTDITSTCTYEYICSSKNIIALPDKEERVPYKIASFDIEASSSHGDFPLPVKTYKKLATQIVDIINKRIENDRTTLMNILKRVIMTAFGYNIYENVDKVYPKKAPKKETLVQIVDDFINNPIEIKNSASKLTNTENSLTEWITINKPNVHFNDADGDNDDNEVENDIVQEVDNEDTFDKGDVDDEHKSNIRANNKKSATTYLIMDILTNINETRENKINKLNESMTSIFPELEGDKVTFIATTFSKFGEKEPYMSNCLVLGSCDSIPGVDIQSYDSEDALLMGWTELIQDENPDIIIGYNIFGFDYEFMYQRACQTGCELDFLDLSRKRGDICAKFDGYGEDREIVGIESTKVVLATGEYDLRYIKMCGRLQIDMYAYLRRDFNLSSYKLDDVAGQFICDDIKKIEYNVEQTATILTTGNLTGIHIGDYIHIEIVGITTNYIEGGKKYHICDLTATTIVIDELINEKWFTTKLRWGIAKDDVSPQDIFRLTNGTATDRAIVAKYAIQDCNLVHHLLNKIDVITGYIEMSNICSVPISFLVFRGQGIKLTSYVAKKCREKQTLIPDLDSSYGDDEGYEGAIVLPPKCSMYMDNPVACVDYASLYPSSMISNNLSPDSKLWTQEYDLDGKLLKENYGNEKELPEGYDYVDVEFDTFQWRRTTAKSRATKVKTGKKICRFAQFPDGKRAILPAILEELLKARADTRKRIKTEKDAFMRNILDKRQLAYKMTANSLYGQCGSKTSTFFEKDVAAATTATGRMMITYAKRIIEEVYGNLVYDTKEHGPVCCRAEYVYGDSVANYTPVFVKRGDNISLYRIEEICEIFGDNKWIRCTEVGKQEKEVCNLPADVETWSEKGWTRLHRVIRHRLANHKKMFRILTHTGLVDVSDDHSLLTADGVEISPNDVKIGTELLHHTLPLLQGKRKLYPNGKNNKINTITRNSQISCAKTFLYASSHGWDVSIDDVNGAYVLLFHVPNEGEQLQTNGIKSIKEIPYPEGEYVYDLTTENHHFSAGVGELIVHNTDSVFFTFNLQSIKGEPIRGKPALEITIEIAQDVAKLCSQYLKAPMELTYEKTLMPFILLSKKRYVGMLFENDAKGDGKLKFMGLSIKRRDSCDYLKEVYGRILSILMKEQNVMSAVEYLRQSLQQLIDGMVPLDKLIITRALRSDYKNPQQIAHRVLADRIGERDPGNKPKSGDRIKYLFINPVVKPAKGKSILMGDRVETPEFVLAGKAKIDYTHYITNQLMNPMTQLFGLALREIYGDKKITLTQYESMIEHMRIQYGDDLEGFNKQKDKYCSKEIEKIIFDPILIKIKNKVENQNAIMKFMAK
jgi:DNA polymerase elongation subunit (family B)